MHPYQNSSLAITGFIVDEGCLYAVLKGTDGDTKLYDKQALAWIISEARKAGTKCAELRKRSSGIDHSQYPINLPGLRSWNSSTHTGTRFPPWVLARSCILLGDTPWKWK